MASIAHIRQWGESICSAHLALLLVAVAGLFALVSRAGDAANAENDVSLVLPTRSGVETFRERHLKVILQENASDASSAAELAKIYIQRARQESDPRYLGYAQQVLSVWENTKYIPHDVRRIRAVLLQAQHKFSASIHDLDRLIDDNPRDVQALLTRAPVYRVLGHYQDALADCVQVLSLAPLPGSGCTAALLSLTGKTDAAQRLLAGFESHLEKQEATLRQWLLITRAEVNTHVNANQAAKKLFKRALQVPVRNAYLLRAYSDFLLKNDRPADALTLLANETKDDSLLLNRTIAAKLSGDEEQFQFLNNLILSRLRDAELRQSTDHYYVTAKHALSVADNPRRAMTFARLNWNSSKEPRDVELYVELAILNREQQDIIDVELWMQREQARLPRVRDMIAQFRKKAL